MDSVTQVVLGAAVGEAVLGHKIGRRAAFWGAICGTLPDLDVFVSFADPVKDFTYHRGVSHSFFFLALATPIIVWLLQGLDRKLTVEKAKLFLLVLLAFYTHILLDSFTVYGTQVLLPFSNYPVALGSIFIIDPLYTLPLLVGLGGALLGRKSSTHISRWNLAGLGLSSVYLLWTVIAQIFVADVTRVSLVQQNIEYENLLITPTPFNSLLWRVVAKQDGGYYEGYYSLLDTEGELSTTLYESQENLLDDLGEEWAVQRLRWFSRGFYKVDEFKQQVTIEDLRMGAEPRYAFRFVVGRMQNGQVLPVKPRGLTPVEVDVPTYLRWVWRRIWTKSAELPLLRVETK